MTRSPAARLGIAAFVGAVVAGCSILTTYDGFTGGTIAPEASVGDDDAGAIDAGDGRLDACAAEIPARPTGADDGFSTLASFGVSTAFEIVDSDNDDGGFNCPLGYDILHGECPACTARSFKAFSSCSTGRDDNVKTGISFAAQLVSLSTPSAIAPQTGLLLGISNWNGELDDPSVLVSLYNVIGRDGTGVISDDRDDGQYVDSNAYVRGGVLVASIKNPFRLRLQFQGDAGTLPVDAAVSNVSFVVNETMVVGDLHDEDGGIAIHDGQLVGRVEVTDFVHIIPTIAGCNFNPANLCLVLDAPTSGSLDGKGAPCTAMTFALGFKMAPAPHSTTAMRGQDPTDFCGDASIYDYTTDADPCGPVNEDGGN